MNFKSISLQTLSAIALLLALSGCAGNGIRITEGSNRGIAESTGTTETSTSRASLVHVNEEDRLVTIRNGRDLPAGFLIAKDKRGKQTAVLKARQQRALGLRTADVLEGQPSINNTITPADAETSARLEQSYPSAN